MQCLLVIKNCLLPSVILSTKRSLCVFQVNEFFSQNLPLNLYTSESQKAEEIKDLYALFDTPSEVTLESILMKNFDVTLNQAKTIAEEVSLKSTDLSSLSYNLELLKESTDISSFNKNMKKWIQLSKGSSVTLSHRIGMLREIGIPATYYNVNKFRHLLNHTVQGLRDRDLITDVNFPRSLFEKFEAPQHVLNSLPSHRLCEAMLLKELWLELTKIFLNWQINMEERTFKRIHKLYYFNYRSLTCISRSISTMKQYFKFDNKKIFSHPMLLVGVPSVLEEYADLDMRVNGIELPILVNSLPSIMRRSLSHVRQVELLLNYTNSKPSYIARAPFIYTYALPTLLSRVEHFIRKTSLTDIRFSPNNVLLFTYFDRSKEKLQDMEAKIGSVSLLPCCSYLLSRNPNIDVVKMKRASIVNFLYFFLGIDQTKAYGALDKMHIAHYPEFCALKRNFVFLINNGFSLKHIRNNFHLLAYPHEVIVKSYQNDLLNSKYGDQYFANKDHDKILQLLLYKANKSYINIGGSHVI